MITASGMTGMTAIDEDQPQAVFGYATRLGYFAPIHKACLMPYPLCQLTTDSLIHYHNNKPDNGFAQLPVELQMADEADFMIKIVADKPFRLAVNEALKLQAKQMPRTMADKTGCYIDAETYL